MPPIHNAQIITFNGLQDFAVITTYTESGFIITPTEGPWKKTAPNRIGSVVHLLGAPNFAPSTIQVARSDKHLFRFVNVDAGAGPISAELGGPAYFHYKIAGLLNGKSVFTIENDLPPVNQAGDQQWATVSGDHTKRVDLLTITVTTKNSGGASDVGYGVRNLGLSIFRT